MEPLEPWVQEKVGGEEEGGLWKQPQGPWERARRAEAPLEGLPSSDVPREEGWHRGTGCSGLRHLRRLQSNSPVAAAQFALGNTRMIF